MPSDSSRCAFISAAAVGVLAPASVRAISPNINDTRARDTRFPTSEKNPFTQAGADAAGSTVGAELRRWARTMGG
jgi:hypothetical protein